jgi:hypothetical protein
MKLIATILISISLSIFFQPSKLYAQNIAIFVDSILQHKNIRIPVYEPSIKNFERKFFTMEFCKSKFIDTAGIYLLQNAEILSINLIFTDYPSSLDLKPLNRSRLIQLNKYLPAAMQNKNTQWLIIRQMDGYDKNSAKDMFHGFVVNYRLPIEAKERKLETDYIKFVTPDPIPEVEEEVVEKVPAKKEKIRHWEVIHKSQNTYNILFDRFIKKISTDKKKIDDEFVKRDSIVVLLKKDALRFKLITGREKELDAKKDTVFILLDAIPKKVEYIPPRLKPKMVLKKDSTFFKIIDRNKFNDLLVIADVTTSMSVYNAQVIQWIALQSNQQNLKALVCFNDGDGKATEQKIIGNTGGIYGEAFSNPTQIGDLMEAVMQKGSGGDVSENNCEAIIKATEMFTNYKDVVLIADSWAPVRDIELVNKITKPIKVIVCGNDLGPHPDYVTIAYTTNGSLHFIDEDVYDFSSLANNKILTIKGTNYMLKNGKVVYALK